MALICDTGGVYALYDADDQHHAATLSVIEAETGPLLLPMLLLAELDYLLTSRLGVDAAIDLLKSIETGEFTLVTPTRSDLLRCRELISQYRELKLGLADAAVVATAERLKIRRLLTVDQRYFRAVQPCGPWPLSHLAGGSQVGVAWLPSRPNRSIIFPPSLHLRLLWLRGLRLFLRFGFFLDDDRGAFHAIRPGLFRHHDILAVGPVRHGQRLAATATADVVSDFAFVAPRIP